MGATASQVAASFGFPTEQSRASQSTITKSFLLFKEAVKEANSVCQSIRDDDDNSLVFSILGLNPDHPDVPPGGILWRLVLKVQCAKRHGPGGAQHNLRVFSARQFVLIHQHLHQEATMLLDLSSSTMLSQLEEKSETNTDDRCAICADADIDMTLPCSHGYCDVCIDQWRWESNHRGGCPICRADLGNGDDDFAIVDPPSVEEMHGYLSESVHARTRTGSFFGRR
eukprot:m.25328 g.25328  ORF g.25328 m.25328 type:complete len:226 (-) comp11587_c0_seq1:72-749(-)